MEFNIIASVGTSEADLAPYPGGSSKTPKGKVRKIYAMLLTNTAASANTLTIKIYKDTTLEKSFNISIPSPGSLAVNNNRDSPILLIPSERTLKAVASSSSVDVLMAGIDD
jgi:hypothetical protein